MRWVLIGEIVATQGNKGEVRVLAHTEFPERFSTMTEVLLFRRNNNLEPDFTFIVENSRFHKGFVILKLETVDNIDQALALKGLEIKVDRNDVVPLPSGRNYIFELIGLQVVTTEGLVLGEISDVLQTGANDVYIVKPQSGVTDNKEILIPVIAEVVVDINLETGSVLVDLPDGLLE